MNKLFFDDVRKEPAGWALARDVLSAMALMESETWDVMSLDHDIGFQMMCDQCQHEIGIDNRIVADATIIEKLMEGCSHRQNGTHLAKWMVEHLKKWPALIIIHSANPYGADRMVSILRDKTVVVRALYGSNAFYALTKGDSNEQERFD